MARFRPSLVPTIATALGLIILLALGTWQSTRYLDKLDQEAQRAQQSEARAKPLTSSRKLEPAALNYRKVVLQGQVLSSPVFLIKHRVIKSQPGFWVISPLRFEDGSHLLVNRGWIPFKAPYETLARLKSPSSTTTASWSGLFYVPPQIIVDEDARAGHDQRHTLDDGTPVSQWDSVDLEGILTDARLEAPRALVVLDKSHSGEPFPIASNDYISSPFLTSERHLGYALTWYGLALALLVMYLAAAFGLFPGRAKSEAATAR